MCPGPDRGDHGGVGGASIRVVRDRAEVSALARLYRAWDAEGRADPAADPGFEQAFAAWWAAEAERRRGWLAEVDEQPVGFADLALHRRAPSPGTPARRWGYVDGMYVLTGQRDRGIGALLLAALLGGAEQDELSALILHPTGAAVRFYQRAGFHFEPADPKPRMRKLLPGNG